MAKEFKPAPEFIIEDLDTLKVLSHPIRLDILKLLGRTAQTVKEVGKQLNLPASKLYYHVNLMEKHKLITVVDTRIVSGIIEKQYMVTAYRYQPGKALLEAAPEFGQEEIQSLALTVVDKAREELSKSFAAGAVAITEDAPKEQQLQIGQAHAYLTKAQARQLHEKLEELLQEVSQFKDETTDEQEAYSLLFLMFPIPKEEANE